LFNTQQFQIQNLSIDRMLACSQTIDNEVNKSWIARVIRTQTVSLNLEFGIADRAIANLTTVGVASDRGIAVYLLWANLKMPIKLESS
jgi:hypothetical protein